MTSLRSLARIQPFWTNVSLPSGRTSLTVACRSTSGVEERTHRWTAPPPITVVFVFSGADTYDTAVPAGFCFQFHCHCDALPHRPPEPVLLPKSVSGSALALEVYWSMPGLAADWSVSVPSGPRYQ